MNAISLFSGCGGCSLGLRSAGFKILFAADIDASACETYAANLGQVPIWNVDLATVNSQQVINRTRIDKLPVDLVVGGPPCQGFSSAGARDWNDPRNALLKNFVEVVSELKPAWFVMENVEGLLTANNGFFITETITRFLEAGYWVKAKKIYMERYGLPQRRKRVFVIGNLENCEFDFPSPTHSAELTFEEHLQLSVIGAISDLPPPSDSGTVHYNAEPQNNYQIALRRTDGEPIQHHQSKRLSATNQRRVSLLAQGATMRDLPEDLRHASFNRRAFRRVMDGTPTEKRGGAPSGLKRLCADASSLTITSASPSEFVHPIENRLLTLRECARVQSFPDSFEFRGSWSAIATQIGNAVPPLFMEVLAKHIQALARRQPVRHPEGRWLGIDATKSTGMSPALVKMLAQLEERTLAYAR